MNTKLLHNRNSFVLGGAFLLVLLPFGCLMTGGTHATPPQVAGADFVGSAQCAQCHDDVFRQYYDTTHAHIVASGAKGREHGCEACHGPGSLHVASGGEPVHIVKGMESCASCHQDVQSRFRMSSHHPLVEGIVSCASCHEPHGSKKTTLTSTNALCTSCHQSVRGPHVFDHPPVAENCTTCHNPHGSPNRRMLELSQPMLCLQCHSIANNRHGQTGANASGQRISAAILRNCTSCHSQVHGSSSDQHLRY